jgi:3-dehydroquinate synthase
MGTSRVKTSSSTEDSLSTEEEADRVSSFRIQETDFELPEKREVMDNMPVASSPRPYSVEFTSTRPLRGVIDLMISSAAHPVVLADRRTLSSHLAAVPALTAAPTFAVDATEEFKSVDGALQVIDFMDEQRMSRSSLLVVVGGGIVQDVGAFAACVYKRGVPWIYVPTTLLAQADSCIGAKSGLNFHGAKNLVGVFSAPRGVVVHTGFLSSLAEEALLSGLGEIFRLSIIGGSEALEGFERRRDQAASGDLATLEELIRDALAVKRAVIEVDEFELDLRRSMNFGHSIGHALEAITGNAIPHGIAVAVGVLVESDISHQRGMLSENDLLRLLRIGAPIISERVRSILDNISFDDILGVLFRDKKVEGTILKLIVPERIGQIRFVDFPLEPGAISILENSLGRVLAGV